MLKDGTAHHDLGADHFERRPPRSGSDSWSRGSPNSVTKSNSNPFPRLRDV
jgi:hypothetical protein